MDRILEPELMTDAAQAVAYAGADFVQVNQGFVDRFRACFPKAVGGTMVDLGCGPGDIPVRFARALPDFTITAVDGSEPMIALARQAVEQAGRGRADDGSPPPRVSRAGSRDRRAVFRHRSAGAQGGLLQLALRGLHAARDSLPDPLAGSRRARVRARQRPSLDRLGTPAEGHTERTTAMRGAIAKKSTVEGEWRPVFK